MSNKCNKCKLVELAYRKGQSEGYTAGVREGRKDGRKVLEEDLIGIYGSFAMCAHKNGWKDATIKRYLKQIQNMWVECFKDGVNIIDKVKEECGFDITIVTEDEVEL